MLKDPNGRLHVKGLSGSLDAIVAAATLQQNPIPTVFVMHDREEAGYFQNDLENLLSKEVALFPTSYKKPYQYEEVDNANILQRAEVLSKIQQGKDALYIVTYPEGLTEKVINKKSLAKSTFGLKVGDQLDVNFLMEVLFEHGFEKHDFVFEPGNFSIRGGIVDIYSYNNDLPYRIELLGKEVESIRTFEPESQLSIESRDHISIIPDVQTKMLQETREAFLDYLPNNCNFWFKNLEHTYEVIQKNFDKISEDFEKIRNATGDSNLITDPIELFENRQSFKAQITERKTVEFGRRFVRQKTGEVIFEAKPQPSFNKQFDLLVNSLHEHHEQGYSTLLCSESLIQLDKLRTIIEELDVTVKHKDLGVGLREGFIDHQEKVLIFTDHQIFERFHRFKSKDKPSRSKSITMRELKSMQPGDYVTHIDHGVGRFAGMEKRELPNGKMQEAIRLIYKDGDLLYISVHSLHKIAKYSSKDGAAPAMNKLGSPEWEKKKSKVKKRVRELAIDLISLYAKRKAAPGFAFSRDTFLQAELETSFLYEDTPDQAKATLEVKTDMEAPHPMDRLVCGDVGFGKTEVAIRAAFKAVNDSKQVAILVPTTVLASQHYKTFKARLKNLPCKVDFLNRFRTAKEIRETLKKVEAGEVDILIGTHMLVGKRVKFKNLGLLIIDEEQKFGVATKEKLKEMAFNLDVLTLSATPIPRTLQFSLMGSRDMSIIATPPPNRQPVTTEVHNFDEEIIRDAIIRELKRGGQVFFVHNRVNDIESIANIILKLVPDARIGIAHGQMEGKQLEKAMLSFIDQDYDILVSTNLIESGLDIPNANTIIINRAHMYGLSDLHQMRGRVGRSNKKAYCYLLTPRLSDLTSDARKRLTTLEEFSDLGDGLKVAMKDLDIRGAGDLLGGEQSGFINDLGFETYHKILDETIGELKQTAFKDLFQSATEAAQPLTDCNIETDLEVVIPEDYVTNISERLRLYNDLDVVKNQEELDQFKQSVRDRFGELPDEMENLCETVKLRWKAQTLGFERLRIKGDSMKGYVKVKGNDQYFQSETFGRLLAFMQANPKKMSLKELKGQMVVTFPDIASLEKAIDRLGEILS